MDFERIRRKTRKVETTADEGFSTIRDNRTRAKFDVFILVLMAMEVADSLLTMAGKKSLGALGGYMSVVYCSLVMCPGETERLLYCFTSP